MRGNPRDDALQLPPGDAEQLIFQSKRSIFLDELIYFGKQLYFKAKEIANNHNSNLYGGEIQTNDAKQVWNSFVRNGMTKTDSDGKFFI